MTRHLRANSATPHPTEPASAPAMMPATTLTRRACLVGVLAATGATCAVRIERATEAARIVPIPAPRDTLVVVLLRGGLDGLSLCVPHGDDDLYRARPHLAVPAPGGSSAALDLDGFFGLAPAARALEAPFRAGHLAIVHAAGLQQASRSHFDAQRRLEAGQVGALPVTRPGWLARLLAHTSDEHDAPLRAVSIGRFLSPSLAGAPEALAIEDPRTFRVLDGDARALDALRALHAGATPAIRESAGRSVDALNLLASTRIEPRQPSTGDPYPDTDLGRRLALAAAWIRARIGVDVLTIDATGWDHHRAMGPIDGALAGNMDDLARGLAAFARDLGRELDRTTLVVLSEFGRRVAENASLGTDHGHGTCLLVLGGSVAGGRVHGRWPSLAPGALDQGDLAITTDVRDVLAEIASRRLGARDLGELFPGRTPSRTAASLLV